jgi:hypothetical protein
LNGFGNRHAPHDATETTGGHAGKVSEY